MSGYPSRAESPHDWIENSHASTVLAYAHGLATALQAGGPDEQRRRIVAVLGDGSLTGGMAFEGLNNLGHSGANAIIVLNDNGRSYAPTVSLLTESLVKIRSNPVYMNRQRRLESMAAKLPVIGGMSLKGIEASKAAIREAFEPQAFFEPLGVRYMGPFDGHDIAELETALVNAGKFEGPVVLHVKTQKGRGYAPAENDQIKAMHDTSPRFLDGEVRPTPPPGEKLDSYTEAFTESLVKLGEEHPELVAITAAMPDSTGLLPFRDRFPDRCFDVGIAEQHAVTAAAGMAMGGLRPVVAVYSTFATRAFDQVNLDVGLHQLPVIFCLDRAGVTGSDGPSHHGILDLVLLSKVPGMTIFCPSSYQELQQMLTTPWIIDGPVCIRWPKTAAPSVPPEPGRPRPAGPPGPLRRARRVPDRRGQDAGGGPGGGGPARRGRRVGHRVGPPGRPSRSTRPCSTTPPATGWWSRSRTAWPTAASAAGSPGADRRAASGSRARGAGAGRARPVPAPRRRRHDPVPPGPRRPRRGRHRRRRPQPLTWPIPGRNSVAVFRAPLPSPSRKPVETGVPAT